MSGASPPQALRDLATRVAESPDAPPHELLGWLRTARDAGQTTSETSLHAAEAEWRRRWGRVDVPTAELSRLLAHMAALPTAFELAGWLDARSGWLACVRDPRGVEPETLQLIAKAVARDPDAMRVLQQQLAGVETPPWRVLRERAPALQRALLAMRDDARETGGPSAADGHELGSSYAWADRSGAKSKQEGGSGWARVLLFLFLAGAAGRAVLRSSKSERASKEMERVSEDLKRTRDELKRLDTLLDGQEHSPQIDKLRDQLRELQTRDEERRSRRRGEEPVPPASVDPGAADGGDDQAPRAPPR